MPSRSPSYKPKALSSEGLAELTRLAGFNPVLSCMIRNGMPLDRETYIGINWGGKMPTEVDGDEQEVLDLLPQ